MNQNQRMRVVVLEGLDKSSFLCGLAVSLINWSGHGLAEKVAKLGRSLQS